MTFKTVLGTIALAGIVGVSLGLTPRRAPEASPEPTQAVAAAAAAEDTFTIDGVHSGVVFKIRHMDVANFYGRFNSISGTYSPAEGGSFDITVQAASVDTGNKGRDDHLRSPDFFNTSEYPTLTFKSTSVKAIGDNKLAVTGDLTMHGVTKPITVEMDVFPAKETRQGVKCGFETIFTVKRTDFGMDTYVTAGGLGDEVQVIVAVEGVKK